MGRPHARERLHRVRADRRPSSEVQVLTAARLASASANAEDVDGSSMYANDCAGERNQLLSTHDLVQHAEVDDVVMETIERAPGRQ